MFAFIDAERQVDFTGLLVGFKAWLGNEIEEAVSAIDFAHILQTLAKLGGREHVALAHAKNAAEYIFRRTEEFNAYQIELLQAILGAFVYVHAEVRPLAGLVRIEEWNAEACASHIFNLRIFCAGLCSEVAFFLVKTLNAAHVFFELGGVVGLCEKIFEKNGLRNANRTKILHRTPDHGITKGGIALDVDLANLNLGAFGYTKIDFEGRRWNLANLWSDCRKLATALGEILFEHV